jgi:hypothetical protein
MAVTHPFVSAKADGGDSSLVRPSDWNASHVFTGAQRVQTAALTVEAGASLVVSRYYEIASGVTLELAAGGDLEIT